MEKKQDTEIAKSHEIGEGKALKDKEEEIKEVVEEKKDIENVGKGILPIIY